MPHHAIDAQLLAAGLYLQLTMHKRAGERFQTLLATNIPRAVRNKAWFYLGKIWYERGSTIRSEQALNRIQGEMAPQLEAERMHLLVNVLMPGTLRRCHRATESWQGRPTGWPMRASISVSRRYVPAGCGKPIDPDRSR